MRSHKSPTSIHLGLGLLLNLFVNVFAYPVVDQYNNDVVQNQQILYEPSFGGEQPYVRFEPQPYIYQTGDLNAIEFDQLPDALTQVDEPRRDLDTNGYTIVSENENAPSKDEFLNGVHSLLADKEKEGLKSGESLNRSNNFGRSMDEDDKGNSIEPDFLNAVYSTLLQKEEQQNSSDRNTARDNEKRVDPSFLNEIRALIFNIMKQEHANAQNNSTAYVTDLKSNGSVYQNPQFDYRYESGYVFHPAPASLTQTIPEVNFGGSMVYNGNPNVYTGTDQKFFLPYIMPMEGLPISKPTQTPPTKPSEDTNWWETSFTPGLLKPGKPYPPAPLPTYGFPSAGFGSPSHDSFYLQPMFQAPVPMAPVLFQYWPASYPDANKSVDWRDEDPQKVDTKPNETNLTKYDIDPVTEKKSKAHSTNRAPVKEKKINSNTQYRSDKNAVIARSIPDYDDGSSEGPSQKNIPLMKKVLIPLSPTENRISSNRIEQKEPVKPRYKVLYHLEKTYVPI